MTQYRRAKVEIDLAALQHNANLAKQTAKSAQVMSAIKANAYGHGIVEVASALKGIVDEYAVASIDDVLAIRNELTECDHIPVTVLSGFYRKEEILIAANNNASLVVYDQHQVDLLLGDALDSLPSDQTLLIWLKVDTGMSRLGLESDQLIRAVEKLERLPRIKIRGVISHFANADEVDHPLNKKQLQAFEQVRKEFQHKDWHWSLANSSAILSGVGNDYDWVRPGIMLYGSSPFADKTAAELGLQAVMTFSSEVISIRRVKQGHSIGYGSTWTAEKNIEVAVIACGYGDGYPRVIKENTPVIVDGHRTVILGRVSMDLMVIDITNIKAQIGSQVVLWGKGLSVDEIAKSVGTIGYELLCGVTTRVERQYTDH